MICFNTNTHTDENTHTLYTSLSLALRGRAAAHTHTHTSHWAMYLMGASMILLSRLWCSALATLSPVHSTATDVAKHRVMPRQHNTLNTDRYHEWLKPQCCNTNTHTHTTNTHRKRRRVLLRTWLCAERVREQGGRCHSVCLLCDFKHN